MRRAAAKSTTESSRRLKPVKIGDLMRNGPVLEIDHDGQIYRLRITRNRKLILTK